MFKLLVCGLAAVCLFAQQPGATEVNINTGPSRNAYQSIFGYSGDLVIWECQAISVSTSRLNNRVAISAATNANPVVFTSTGHGFEVNTRPKVLIAGGTGNWTAVNGEFTATIIDANTFSVPVDSTTFGALTGSLTFATTAPRTTVAEWAVKLYAYDGTNHLINISNLNGLTRTSKCSEATTAGTNKQ